MATTLENKPPFDPKTFHLKFKDMQTKVYPNGRKGEYFCYCHVCKKQFIGHKWDGICPDCENPGSELNIAGQREYE